jgi:RNA-directed DNA polymerase
LIFNVAMSVLDEHLHRPWKPGEAMAAHHQRVRRRAKGLPNWQTVRYADDFVVLVDGTEADAEALREEIAGVLAPLGLRLSPVKTRIVHMSDGLDFLGFRIQWKRKRGTGKWYVYTFIADRPIRSLKGKIRALTRRTSQQDLGYVLARLNMVMHGWARFFRHAVAKQTFSMLDYFTWRRVAPPRPGPARARPARRSRTPPAPPGPPEHVSPADPGRPPVPSRPPFHAFTELARRTPGTIDPQYR